MNDLFKWMRISAVVLPLIRQAVELVEDLASELPGEQKKNLAMALVRRAVEALKTSPDIKIKELDDLPLDFIFEIVDGLIDTVVSIFNATLWKKD